MSKAKLLPDCFFVPTAGRPSVFFPSARTRSSPAITLDIIIDLSSSTKTVAICIIARPNGPVASIPCCSLISATPAASSSAIAWATCITERPSRSIDQTDIEATAHRVLEHLVERWAFLAALAAADPLILIFFDDLEPAMLRQLGQHHPLVLGGLATRLPGYPTYPKAPPPVRPTCAASPAQSQIRPTSLSSCHDAA